MPYGGGPSCSTVIRPAGLEKALVPGAMPGLHSSHCDGLQNAGVVVPLDITNPWLPVIPARIYPPQGFSVTLQIPSGLLYPLITERALGAVWPSLCPKVRCAPP